MFVLDTNVVSELRKVRAGKGDDKVGKWSDSVDPAALYISAITILELEVGILRLERNDRPRAQTLRTWLTNYVLVAFDRRILPVDTEVGLQAAKLQVPNSRPVYDGVIAATALVHGMTMVTRKVADFASSGLAFLNPWNQQIS